MQKTERPERVEEREMKEERRRRDPELETTFSLPSEGYEPIYYAHIQRATEDFFSRLCLCTSL